MNDCLICKAVTHEVFVGKILGKYEIKYYRCPNCGLIQTETPYWLNEAYSNAIVDSDIGLVGRNYGISNDVEAILKMCFGNTTNTHLDYGGGYGLFTRLMRDKGFDFEWYDKYCVNLFAQHFERSKEHYDVVTAFELLEHLPHPYDDLDELMKLGDTVICSTELLPNVIPQPSEWWYYALDGGQHITFYTKKAMEYIAQHYKRYYYGIGCIHIFSSEPISNFKIQLVKKFPSMISRFIKRDSLLAADYGLITGQRLR